MIANQSKHIDQQEFELSASTNCGALVAELILDHFEIPKKDQSLHLLHGMGHGMEMGSACGGLIGGIFAINHLLNLQGASKDEVDDAHMEFKDKFINLFGMSNCKDIIELHLDTDEYDRQQTQFCGNLMDESTKEAVGIINFVSALINPINYSMNRH